MLTTAYNRSIQLILNFKLELIAALLVILVVLVEIGVLVELRLFQQIIAKSKFTITIKMLNKREFWHKSYIVD